MSDRQISRAPGLARLFGVLALLAGIVAMHSAVFAVSGHAQAMGDHGTMTLGDVVTSPSPDEVGPVPGATGGIVGGDAATWPEHRDAFSGSTLMTASGDGALGGRPINQPTPVTAGPTAMPATGHELSAGGTGSESNCPGDGCGGTHGGMHGCVFILAAAAALFALVLLYRMAVDRPGGGVTLPRHWRPRAERPPPWTVLTLAQLAILRI